MKKVSVSASLNYDVLIGGGLLKDAGKYIKEISGVCKAAIITDDIVDALYAEKLITACEKEGFQVCKYVFKNGEHSKNLSTYCDILEFLADNALSRSDIVISLGGGVTGDMAGYAAATYLRGIKFIQIPTTILASIDSSVGGKTAVNLKAGKNLAGVFYQPSLVICDTDTLNSLPEDVFSDGTAEAIKYGVLKDEELFDKLSGGNFKDDIEDIIYECVKIKADTVKNDEYDTGERQLLNLGHTIGHAIEKCSGFSVTHGHAVAVGMIMIARASFKLSFSSEDCSQKIEKALKANNLPTNTKFTAGELAKVAFSDKKRSGNSINFIIPKKIGSCVIQKVPTEDILKIFEAGEAYEC